MKWNETANALEWAEDIHETFIMHEVELKSRWGKRKIKDQLSERS